MNNVTQGNDKNLNKEIFMGVYKHFGCIIKKPDDAKLSRSNYAHITIATRRNSFRNVGIYSIGKKGIYPSFEDALSAFFKIEGNDLIELYKEKLTKYKKILHDINIYPD
ncbi:MAG: hypothetical protein K2J32_10560, partial [Ruminococcus sp.]|nr:hypothetical protein [Ruminococcus sp.]